MLNTDVDHLIVLISETFSDLTIMSWMLLRVAQCADS